MANQAAREHYDREDIMMFVQAAMTCTAQHEYYGGRHRQGIALSFLHRYLVENYRRVYARCLAIGLNHHNVARVVFALLQAGAPRDAEARAEENALIAAALRDLPAPAVFRLFTQLRRARVNNRRTRATMRHWLAQRATMAFDAIKYRKHLRSAVRHAHVSVGEEPFAYLFRGAHSQKSWTDPLFDAVRRARYDQGAIYELPFSIAEGLATAKGIPRERFLKRAKATMTTRERQRWGSHLKGGVPMDRMRLTRLCSYVLSLNAEDRLAQREAIEHAFERAVDRTLRRAPFRLGRVAAVLDRSTSMRGSFQKRNRPLAVTWGIHRLLKAAASTYRAFWTWPTNDELRLSPRGQTDLATPLLAALRWRPELLIVVSDGYDNAPPGAAAEILRVVRHKLAPEISIIHVNPVFDAEEYQPRTLGSAVPSVGVRDAEDLPTMQGFARFVTGDASLKDLLAFLQLRAAQFLSEAA